MHCFVVIIHLININFSYNRASSRAFSMPFGIKFDLLLLVLKITHFCKVNGRID